MTIYIKNIVCDRCKQAVKNVLDAQAITTKNILLGEAEIADELC